MNNIKPFVIKRHDTLPVISVNIRTRGYVNELIPYSLTGVTACTFSMSDEYGNLKISSASANILVPSAGTIQYSWILGDTDTTGVYNGEFELTFSGGGKMSIPTVGSLDIHVINDINKS